MKVGVLTSSRADYGIYRPLLQKLKNDSFFCLEIIAFGTHLSRFHGYTLDEIETHGYPVIHQVSSLLTNDDEQAITTSYGLTVIKFADFWAVKKYDLVFCLGDRFEMSAAVQSTIPFGIRLAHIHGGETTLGAIDNKYRHQITLAASVHFTSTDIYKDKVFSLTESNEGIYTVGSLSLDNIEEFKPLDSAIFYEKYQIPLEDFALVTFHPETISSEENLQYVLEMKWGLSVILQTLNLVITMPNADTLGSVYREAIIQLKSEFPKSVVLVENFGKDNYFSAMHYAKILIGNTSSGILEAASFKKYVINVGNRQKGRAKSKNVMDSAFIAKDIAEQSLLAYSLGDYEGENIYYRKGAADSILNIIKNEKF